MCNLEYVLENGDAQTPLGLWVTKAFSARRPELVIVNEKKTTSQIVDFAVPADLSIKEKENKKEDNYQELARELKNYRTWSDADTNGALGTVTKGLIRVLDYSEIRGQVKTIQTTMFLRLVKI